MKKISKLQLRPELLGRLAFIVSLVVIAGFVWLHVSRADSPNVISESETGTLAGPVGIGDDATASGGKYVKFQPSSSDDPYGVADYCKLEGTSTVIYGWAYDRNATATADPKVTLDVGGHTVTVASSVANYRDDPINKVIDGRHLGDPKPGVYGFRADMGTLNKGAVYATAGTITDVGAGANADLSWNSSGAIDGVAANTFTSSQVPNACLGGAASSGSPYGYADYCTIESGNTIIWGWAYDPQADAAADPKVTINVGGKKVTVSSSVAGYRDDPINTSLESRHAGDPQPGSYGYKANMGSLNKGATYPISGTVTNIGAGDDIAIGRNTSGLSDGVARSTFAGGVIPSACLGGTAVAAITKACGDRAAPPVTYDHVIWIIEENREFDQVIGAPSAPYMTSIAKACGTATNYNDAVPCAEVADVCDPFDYHSSIEYPAVIAGTTCKYGNGTHGTGCWYSLSSTQKNNLSWRSLFGQVRDAGGTWKQYDESAPGNCSGSTTTLFHAIHNPAQYFSDVADQCTTNSVATPAITCKNGSSSCSAPSGVLANDIKNGTLPDFSLIIPNVANEMHGVDEDHVLTNEQWVNQGDMWFKTYMNLIVSSAEYKKGRTAVFVMWDEGRSAGGKIPFLAISPSADGGTTTTSINNYAVLRATEDMLGISEHLGCASGTPLAAAGSAPPAGSSCFSGATAKIRTLFNM